MQFYNMHDARMRLQGSVIPYRGSFWYVQEVRVDEDWDPETDRPIRGDPYVSMSELGRRYNYTHVDLDDLTVETFKVPLGYVNFENQSNQIFGCALYQRFSSNQTRMGLSSRNSGWYNNNGPNLNAACEDDGFLAMLNNEYPTYRDIFDNPLLKQEKVAFSRDFAIEPATVTSSILYYREERVGECNSSSILLYPNGHYLLECLQRLTEGVKIEVYQA